MAAARSVHLPLFFRNIVVNCVFTSTYSETLICTAKPVTENDYFSQLPLLLQLARYNLRVLIRFPRPIAEVPRNVRDDENSSYE